MDIARLRKIQREVDSITSDDIPPEHAPTQIIAPTVTRQPALDVMLSDISTIAKMELERLRKQVMSGQFLDRDDRKAFKEYCESVLRTTRVEMEVETHVAARTSALTGDQIRDTVLRALAAKKVPQEVQYTVLEALGMRR